MLRTGRGMGTPLQMHFAMASLLAVDLGVRTGLACFSRDAGLLWYRSSNFGSAARLRKAVGGILREAPELTCLALEGRGELADVWTSAAEKRGVRVRLVSAETWRQELLLPRQQRSGVDAKRHAIDLARSVIDHLGGKKPTALRHDTAEAILLGVWALLAEAWLTEPPPGLPRR